MTDLASLLEETYGRGPSYTTADMLDRMPSFGLGSDWMTGPNRFAVAPRHPGYIENMRRPADPLGPDENLAREIGDAARERNWPLTSGALAAAILSGVPGGRPKPSVRISSPIKPVFHGTPHDFNEFSLSKIGTGEGAQAYGHGLYFAERPETAQTYRDALAGIGGIRIGGEPMERPRSGYYAQLAFDDLMAHKGDVAAAIERALGTRNGIRSQPGLGDQVANVLRMWEKEGVTYQPGKMYEVALHATPEQFLDWDKSLSRQPPLVQDIVGRTYPEAVTNNPDMTGSAVIRGMNGGSWLGPMMSHDGSAPNPLRGAGIPGIRYLDEGSRNPERQIADLQEDIARAQRGKISHPGRARLIDMDIADTKREIARLQQNPGTSNYVVWSPEIIEILRKYGIAAPVAGASLADMLAQPTPTPEQ